MRVRRVAFVLAAVVSLLASAMAAEPPTIDQLRGTYQALVEREGNASRLTVQLDRDMVLHAVAAAQRHDATELRRTAAGLRDRSDELLKIDLADNADLQKLYGGAAALETPEASELLVRTALLHWMQRLRQASMQGFHTEVEGLIDDPDCAGDIIGDRLLQVYFDSLFDTSAEGPGKAIAALTAIARQTACLGTQQSAMLASNLVRTYDEVVRFLRLNGVYVDAYLAQAAVQPLLLFYDVEKHRGARSPLTQWFSEHRDILLKALSAKRHPPLWHGFWLYDRRSGRLIGYRPTLQPRDENDVNLAAFYGSLTTRPNLGDFSCSFAEMIERGDSPLGYFCAGSTCQQQTAQPGSTSPSTVARGATPGHPGGFSTRGAEFEDTLCQQSGAGDGRKPDGGSICAQGGGLSVGGAMKAASAVRCLSQQVVRPGTEGFRCLAEAMGFCSNPAQRVAKELQQTSFAGVKLGRECELGKGSGTKGAGGSKGVGDEDLPALPPKSIYDADQDVYWAEHKFGEKDDAWKQAKKDLDNENRRHQEKVKELKEKEKQAAAEKKKADEAVLAAKKKAEEERKKWGEEKKKKAEEERKKKAEEEKKKKQKEKEDKKKGKGTPACPPGTPDCGDNSCTAMADQMGQTLMCAQRAITGDDRDPHKTHPGGCNPTMCDPVEATGQGPATGKCLATLQTDATVTSGRGCWAVECAHGRTTGHNCCEGADAGTGVAGTGAAPNRPMCSELRCDEGSSPSVGAFGCECRQSGGLAVGGLPPTPRGSFSLLPPPAFLDTNARPRGSSELPEPPR